MTIEQLNQAKTLTARIEATQQIIHVLDTLATTSDSEHDNTLEIKVSSGSPSSCTITAPSLLTSVGEYLREQYNNTLDELQAAFDAL